MSESILIPPPIQRQYQNQAPLSASQESIWFLHQLAPDSAAYNVIYLFRMLGGVDRYILERSLNELIRRHEILRTIYLTDKEGKPIQVIQPYDLFKVSYLDFSSLRTDEKEQVIRAYAIEHGSEPFDLENGPVARFALLHVGSEEDYLFFTIHHIAFDDWSRHVFIQDLVQVYTAYQSREESNLPPLPIQYTDYALWQREWISGETRTALIQHWKSIFCGELPVLTLPTDHPRQVQKTDHGSRYHFDLSPSLSARIKEFCRNERLTPSHLLMAVYALFLMRYAGQEDIIIGCPFANRPRSEQGGLIGYFVNTLPIRLNLEGNPGVRDLLKQVRSVMLDASTWKALPFETMVAELAPRRDLSRTPIYQVMINILNVPKRQTSIPGTEIDLFFREQKLGDYDISFEFSETDDLFKASLLYNSDLFDKSTILRMISHYQNILDEILTKPDHSISELEMLLPEELHQIVVGWNGTKVDVPQVCIHDLITIQANKNPDWPAVVCNGNSLSYGDLEMKANQLAHYLRANGVGTGSLVGIYLQRTESIIVSQLAILKAGGAYVPLDLTFPLERITYMVNDSDPVVIITSSNLSNKLPNRVRKICIDTESVSINACESSRPLVITSNDSLAYVMYTSGSTGRPKGAMNVHKGIVNYMTHMINQFHFGPSDRVVQFTPLSFDSSVWNVLGTLAYGGMVFFMDDDQMRDPDYIYKAIIDHQATYINLVPTMLRAICESALAHEPKINRLRLISSGGDVLREADVELAHRVFGEDLKINNQYGPTECSISAIHYLIPDALPNGLQGVPIGKPISNVHIYILDTYLHPVPQGVKGELFIGGIGVGRGYWNRSDLTAERFLPDPLYPESRMYRTGDIVRQLPDGTLCFLGRSDNQVKIRSYRVELSEIEATVKEFPGVTDAVVVLSRRAGTDILVAYISVTQGYSQQKEENLNAYLADQLPFYMLPSLIIQMDALPLTLSGKIDRLALPVPDQSDLTKKEGYTRPSDNLEQQLVQIWEKLLNIQPIGINDNFFELGGHSLLAVQLFSQIENRLGKQLPLATLFQSPTISGLAAIIREKNQIKTSSSIVPIKPEGHKPPFFMVHGIGGNVLNYQGISNYLDPDQPFYGLQSKGLDGKSTPLYTVEDMATHYINEICALYPEGPYMIGGHSFGGWIAVEMAKQLYQKGCAPSLVIVLDTGPDSLDYLKWSERILFFVKDRVKRASDIVRDIIISSQNERKKYIEKMLMRRKRRRDIRKWAAHPPDLQTDDLQKIIHYIRQANHAAAYKYSQKKFPGKVTLFRSQQQSVGRYDTEYLGWQHFSEAVDVVVIPGSHMTLLEEPNVQVLASKLQYCIDRFLEK